MLLCELFQTYVLAERQKDMLVDGWKWKPLDRAVGQGQSQYINKKASIR